MSEEYVLTATTIAEKVGCKPAIVNKVLMTIGFLKRDDIGYFSINAAGETITGKGESTYVKWHKSLLDNKLFLDAIENYEEEKEESIEEPSPLKKKTLKVENKVAPVIVNKPMANLGLSATVQKTASKKPKTKEIKSPVVTLTATQIGKKFNLKGKEVNQILLELNFMEKEEKGYKILKEELGVQKMHEERPYVSWYEDILENKLFLDVINASKKEIPVEIENKCSIKENSCSTKENKTFSKKEECSEKISTPGDSLDIEGDFKFNRDAFPTTQRSQNGMKLRSRAETIVSDWLYTHYFSFSYERRLPLPSGEEFYSDFYLNKEKIYIEVWGMMDAKYSERRKIKEEKYKEQGYKLIGLDPEEVDNIDDYLPLKLATLGVSVD